MPSRSGWTSTRCGLLWWISMLHACRQMYTVVLSVNAVVDTYQRCRLCERVCEGTNNVEEIYCEREPVDLCVLY